MVLINQISLLLLLVPLYFNTGKQSLETVTKVLCQPIPPSSSCVFDDFEDIQSYFKWRSNRATALIMAHRGGPLEGYPENSMVGFQHVVQNMDCPIIEMDVRMTKDSILVLLHEEVLDKTTSGSDLLGNKTWDQIKHLYLQGKDNKLTSYTIPLFKDVLKWGHGKAIMAIDAKPGVDLDRVLKAINVTKTSSTVFLICYSIEDAQYVYGENNNLMLALGFNSWDDIEKIKNSELPLENLIALTPQELQEKQFYDSIHQMGILCSMGTYGSKGLDVKPLNKVKHDYINLVKNGIDIITTNRPIQVTLLLSTKQ